MSLFRKHDRERQGWITLAEASAVIMDLVPGFLSTDLEIATVFLCFADVDLSGTVSLARFLTSFRIAQEMPILARDGTDVPPQVRDFSHGANNQ